MQNKKRMMVITHWIMQRTREKKQKTHTDIEPTHEFQQTLGFVIF